MKSIADNSLIYKKTGKSLEGYADSDWGNCTTDRRSYTGYTFIYGYVAISWEARKQGIVTLSCLDADHMCLSKAVKEAIYLRSFLSKIADTIENKKLTVMWNES